MVLTVFFSSRISPRTSTVIFFDRSPFATAVVTSAMLRTWLVRLPARVFTLSVRSFPTPQTPLTRACPPSFPADLPLGPPLARAARPLGCERRELVDHGVPRRPDPQELAAERPSLD